MGGHTSTIAENIEDEYKVWQMSQLNITQLLGINLQQIFEGDVFRDICQPLLMNHYKLVGFILLCYLQARYMGM